MSSILQLFMGLYVSRILLNVLGVKDFGLYGVVGSIVTLLGFLNIAMGGASSRYITYELGAGTPESRKKVYTAVVVAHAFLALILFFFAETLGLYYVHYKLEIPNGRLQAALWCYQASIFVAILSIIQVPYNALINSHEKMGFSSLWKTAINILRLLCAMLLYFVTVDKLIYYALFIALVNLIGFAGYFFYCKSKFEECILVKPSNKKLYKDILSFASFSAFSSSSNMFRTQGANLLVNKFFGVAMNASVNIANSAYGNIYAFSYNVIAAFRPQIIKKYATGEIDEMETDMVLSMKYCVAIFSLTAVPIFIDIDYVIRLWLGYIPPYSNLFTRIGLCGSLFALLNIIFTIGIQATSNVKNNSVYISIFSCFSIIIIWIVLRAQFAVYAVYIITAITEFFLMLISFINLKMLIKTLRMRRFCSQFIKLILLIFFASIISFVLKERMEESFARFILITISYLITFGISFLYFFVNKDTRVSLYNKIIIKFKDRRLN